jgi:hypothetical protein
MEIFKKMTTNGVPTSLVEKFLDNLKDLTKNVAETSVKQNALQDSIDETSDKFALALTKVAERLNTPPRHEELEKQLKTVETKLDEYKKEEEKQTELLKTVIKTIKIAAGLFGLALLISAILITVVEKTKAYPSDQKQIEQIENIKELQKTLKEHIEKSNNSNTSNNSKTGN